MKEMKWQLPLAFWQVEGTIYGEHCVGWRLSAMVGIRIPRDGCG
jgi:hypothetical protein